MSVIRDALDGLGRSRLEEKRHDYKPSAILLSIKGRPKNGFCEGCQCYKPAPPKRKKGWRCKDCLKDTCK